MGVGEGQGAEKGKEIESRIVIVIVRKGRLNRELATGGRRRSEINTCLCLWVWCWVQTAKEERRNGGRL